MATGVLQKGLAEEVWLMPCKRNPLKDEPALMSDEERLEMLSRAISYCAVNKNEHRLKICNEELGMPTPSYTYDTFQSLRKKYPEHNFRLLVGADSYLDFKRWYKWEWLEKNLRPLVYPRPGYELGELRPDWTLIENVDTVDISSTEIRDIIKRNLSVIEYLPWM